MSFSPDGKYLAYDSLADDNSAQRGVFVLTVDGSREIAAVAHPSDNRLAGWSPDGKHLLFLSDRTGSPGLWSQAVVDGSPQGAAALIKADLGSSRSLGITASGALYVATIIESSDIEVVSIDLTTGQIAGSPVKPIADYVGANSRPEWSPDGKFMSYVSRREGRLVLAVRELGTGRVGVVSPPMTRITSKAWSPDRKSFALQGRHLNDGYGLFLVDAETGDASRVAANTGINEVGPAWSPDGKKLYYRASVDQDDRGIPVRLGRAIIELDLASGRAHEILRRPRLGVPAVSPDGRWIATLTADAAGRSSTTILFPVSGGDVRELIRVDQPVAAGVMFWTPDSNSIIVASAPSGQVREYWQVSISGGDPRKLDLTVDIPTRPHLHPDGRRLAYTTTTETKAEVWVLENFLPKPGASK
jgi:Tol biopolymer transport system component